MTAWTRLRPLAERLGPAFLLGLVQGALGLALLTRYEWDPAHAHASVRAISDGGLWILRSLHSVLATVLVVLAIVNLGNVWTRATTPTPGTWIARLALVGLLLVALQTGGILAWDQRGWESYQHLTGTAGFDADRPEAARLDAVMAAHVAAIPIALVALAFARAEWRRSLRMWFERAALDGGAALPLLLVAVLLAVAWPPPLGPAPIQGVSLTRPEWPFLWLVPLQEWWGRWGLVAGILVALALAVAAPFVARSWTPRRRVAALWIIVAAFLALEAAGALL